MLIDLPDQKAREQMFRHLLNVESSKPISIAALDFTDLAGRTNGPCLYFKQPGMQSKTTLGYSGSDITLVCKEAAMKPLRAIFAQLEASDEEKDLSGYFVLFICAKAHFKGQS